MTGCCLSLNNRMCLYYAFSRIEGLNIVVHSNIMNSSCTSPLRPLTTVEPRHAILKPRAFMNASIALSRLPMNVPISFDCKRTARHWKSSNRQCTLTSVLRTLDKSIYSVAFIYNTVILSILDRLKSTVGELQKLLTIRSI